MNGSPPKNPVLIVIDVQNGFVNGHSRTVVPQIRQLIRACVNRDIPVVFTRFVNLTDSPFERLIDWSLLKAEPEISIVNELSGPQMTVIDKHFYSAFTVEFEQLAQEKNWQTILLCGISTESCVLKTAADAFERGLRPIVVSDACASDAGTEAHAAGLIVLKYLIGERQIITSADLLGQLWDRTSERQLPLL